MKKKLYFSIIFCLNLLFVIVISSCTINNKNTIQKEYKSDSDYYVGLRLLQENKQKEARSKFINCINKGTYICAKKSAQALTSFGTLSEKTKACDTLIKKFPDSDSLLIAAKHYHSVNELSKIIKITSKIDITEENNELISLRLQALREKKSSSYSKEVYDWFITRSTSQEHYKFYRDVYYPDLLKNTKKITDSQEEQIDQEVDYFLQQDIFSQYKSFSPQDFAISFRILIYKRNYTDAIVTSQILLDYLKQNLLKPHSQLISDLGKTCLYGSNNFYNNAWLFTSLAKEYKSTESEFYFWFYAGRFFEKAGYYFSRAKNAYENAIKSTTDNKKQDNALWYLLNLNLTTSLEETINSLGDYAKQFHQPDYYDDFFDKLIVSILVNGNWTYLPKIISQIDGYATDEITGRFSYICARLIQEGFIQVENKDQEIQKNLSRALKSGTSVYYTIMAAYRLNFSNEQIKNTLLTSPGKTEITVDKTVEKYLLGYAHFGFPEKIYEEWLSFYKESISPECSLQLSEFLYKCANENEEFYSQSLRISSRTFNNLKFDSTPSLQQFKLIYPQGFQKNIDYFSKKYDINSSVIYALVRSESFFDPDVTSNAGAIGLTQLMELTAGDIANKLKRSSYDLANPQDNIEFGTFYLAELLRRLDGSYLQAFFSYNAGITRVRRWLKNSIQDFGSTSTLPSDLFLEVVPYAETREYGRKLLSATIIYDLLYKDINFTDSVQRLLD